MGLVPRSKAESLKVDLQKMTVEVRVNSERRWE